MPFKKAGKKYKSPSGKTYSKKQVQKYLSKKKSQKGRKK